jgi:hypothetical protein
VNRTTLVLLALLGVASCKTLFAPPERPLKEVVPLRALPENMFCNSGVGQPLPERTPETLSEADIKAVFSVKEKDLHSCYKERIRKGYAIEGYVGIRFVVSPKGYAQQLCVVEDATGDADFLECMFGEIGTWQFPERQQSTEVRKRFLFRLEE